MSENIGHEQRVVRLSKLQKLEEMGINAYPHIYRPTTNSEELNQKYKDLPNDTQTEDEVAVAGRVRAIRNSGMFMDIYDARRETMAQGFTDLGFYAPRSDATMYFWIKIP